MWIYRPYFCKITFYQLKCSVSEEGDGPNPKINSDRRFIESCLFHNFASLDVRPVYLAHHVVVRVMVVVNVLLLK